MSKITNEGLTQSGTGCFIAVPYDNSDRLRVNVYGFIAFFRFAYVTVNDKQCVLSLDYTLCSSVSSRLPHDRLIIHRYEYV